MQTMKELMIPLKEDHQDEKTAINKTCECLQGAVTECVTYRDPILNTALLNHLYRLYGETPAECIILDTNVSQRSKLPI